ncbi:MAG: TolC family protein [Bacteroidetes bacterium]|jgi:outer membrane protein TolC|nr:TolC family protein [Bacteroidota bacterium]
MKTLNILIFFLLTTQALWSQTRVKIYELESLTDSAIKYYAISKQAQIDQQINTQNTANIKSSWNPQMQLNGQISYQSDVPKITIPLPGFSAPEIAKDWYKLNLDLSQLIYDGGASRQLQEIESTNLAIELQKNNQHIYHFREMIAGIYFRVLLFDQQLNVLHSSLNGLQQLIDEMNTAVDAGTILISEANKLKVEKMQIKQQITSAQAGRKASLEMLSVFTHIEFSAADSLLIPVASVDEVTLKLQRPELHLFELQQQLFHNRQQLTKTKRRPVIQAFGQAGYGRPGYNMLDDDFAIYAMAGIRFNYKLWDWKNSQRERETLKLGQEAIGLQKADFEQQITAAARSKIAEISKFEQLIEQDKAIISLQKTILQTSTSQLKAGTLTSAGYLLELEKYNQRLINLKINRLQLYNTIIQLNFITGNTSVYED